MNDDTPKLDDARRRAIRWAVQLEALRGELPTPPPEQNLDGWFDLLRKAETMPLAEWDQAYAEHALRVLEGGDP
jgi:hypothetical protein